MWTQFLEPFGRMSREKRETLMRILERREPEQWSDNCTCRHCKSRLAVEFCDLYRIYEDCDCSYCYYYQCPVCRGVNEVTSLLPEATRKEVPTKEGKNYR